MREKDWGGERRPFARKKKKERLEKKGGLGQAHGDENLILQGCYNLRIFY